MVQIHNARRTGTDVPGAHYVGRRPKGEKAPFANPFRLGPDGDRAQVMVSYLGHLRRRPDLVDRMRQELAGRDLVCWCAPDLCHAEIIAHVAAGNPVPDVWPLSTDGPQKELFG